MDDLQSILRLLEELVKRLAGFKELQANADGLARLEAAQQAARRAAQLVRQQIKCTRTAADQR